jgi:hypothetical protein
VNRLRLLASGQETMVALSTRAVEAVAEASESGEPANSLPGIMRSLPAIEEDEENPSRTNGADRTR